jgi:hypothetical protein
MVVSTLSWYLKLSYIGTGYSTKTNNIKRYRYVYKPRVVRVHNQVRYSRAVSYLEY